MKSQVYRSAAMAAFKCGVASSALLVAGTAFAQGAPVGDGAGASNEEIIVTARRRDESLQDVPQTVNAVTSAAIEKLNLTNFKDIQTVVPGLTLSGGVTGSDSGFSLRGTSFNTLVQSPSPTVQFYINEATVDSNLIFQSMYDVGQIEVLRGPQGTLRGRSAPSGAITLTTRKPSLTEVGGYLNFTGTDRGNINVNAAVSVPLIDNVLAIRVAGLVDHNDADGIRSLNNGTSPYGRTESGRVSLQFEPSDTFKASVMYQFMSARYRTFQPVIGFQNAFSGPLSVPIGGGIFFPITVTSPAGPTILPGQRAAVSEGARTSELTFHLVTGSFDWRFAGQKLTYVGAYSKQVLSTQSPQDTYNVFAGFESYQDISPAGSEGHRHEVRLSSEERLFGMLDYTLGVYLDRGHGTAKGNIGPSTPYGASIILSNDAYTSETSFFGSATLHLGERTELTAGARHIHYTSRFPGPYTTLGTGNSLCIPAAGFCFASASAIPIIENAWVWNASLSHHFNDNLLVYGSVGTSYRPPFNILATNTLAAPGYASSLDLRDKPAERSTGVEIGFKSNFLDNRVRLNVAGYRQKFKDNSFYANNIPFYDIQNNAVSLGAFTANADAIVWGVDVDAAVQITPRWNFTAGFAWANGHVDNDFVPCRDANFDGIADNGAPTVGGFQAAQVIVARCKSSQSISSAPKWSLTLQSEYSHPISDRVDGFIRGLFTYNPENPNNNRNIVIEDYGMLNLYTGIRSPDNAWEVSLFAKNLTNTQKIVSYGDTPPNTVVNLGGPSSVSIPVNYRTVAYTARREFGLNVRYAFGSR